MWIFWLIIILVAVIVEIGTVNMLSIWFALGGLVALLVSLFDGSLFWQILLFFIFSFLGLLVFLVWLKDRIFKKRSPAPATNADRIIGKTGLVLETIDPLEHTGKIKVLGQVWTAESETGTDPIPVNSKVQVLALRGVRALVRPLSSEDRG